MAIQSGTNKQESSNLAETKTNGHMELASSTQSSNPPQSDASNFFADPMYSGVATWLGTLLSVAAAIAAWRQANKAETAVTKVKNEQSRQYLEGAHKHLSSLSHHLTPLIHRTDTRGVKTKPILDSAKIECNEALSLPLNKKVQESIEKIQEYLDQYPSTENNEVSRTDLNRLIRNEIQSALRSCSGDIDSLAAQPSE